mmetsp:Transcript_28483/g.54337  ORF Transcript_28483/g.54337 Transcript_28483/m.54337 type:complete len:204 (+) Transcript_28483:270-881(+)
MLAREFRLWSDDVIVSHIDTMCDGRGTCSRAPHVYPSRCQQSEASHMDPRLGEIGRTGRASQMERRYNAAQFASLSSAAFRSARYGSPRYASPRRAADLSRALVADLFTGAADSAKASAHSLFSHHLSETPQRARASRLGEKDASCSLSGHEAIHDQQRHSRPQVHQNCIGRVLEFPQRMIHDAQESLSRVSSCHQQPAVVKN